MQLKYFYEYFHVLRIKFQIRDMQEGTIWTIWNSAHVGKYSHAISKFTLCKVAYAALLIIIRPDEGNKDNAISEAGGACLPGALPVYASA